MKNSSQYKRYAGPEVTKELLDSIEVGDLIRVNSWNRSLRVRGVSKDYFVMAQPMFGKWDYSVCEKKPWPGVHYNQMIGGMFHVGTDWWVFGAPEGYQFNNQEATDNYLRTFELPEQDCDHAELSVRRSVPIYEIYIKKGGKK